MANSNIVADWERLNQYRDNVFQDRAFVGARGCTDAGKYAGKNSMSILCRKKIVRKILK